MFDFGIGYTELFVIAVVAVIVIGPKDLPKVLRTFGKTMAKMRGMAREFQGQVDIAMKDAGMDGIQKDLQSLKSGVSAAMNPVQTALSGAATSLMDEPKKSLPASAPAEAPAPMMASLPNIAPNNDFTRIFNAASEGETRVQGRGLDEAKP